MSGEIPEREREKQRERQRERERGKDTVGGRGREAVKALQPISV